MWFWNWLDGFKELEVMFLFLKLNEIWKLIIGWYEGEYLGTLSHLSEFQILINARKKKALVTTMFK
jgi:hypothetical protein